MGALSWLTGVGLPTLAAFACFAGAAAAWFRIPLLGHYFGLGLACVGVALMANAKGFSDARAMCKADVLQAELMALRRDLDVSHEAQRFAAHQAIALANSERINKELADEIAAMPDVCVANDGHIERLLRLK